MQRPELGSTIDQIDTPALCIDLDLLQGNIRRMAEFCRQHGVAWRPHAKSHKSPDIARLQIEAGAIGITCAKLGEAEVMAEAGIRDLLIANELAGPIKMRRLAALCQQADPIATVDHIDQVVPMSQAVVAAGGKLRVIVEVDIGLNRTGVAPGEPAVRLGEFIARQPGLELAGIMGYEGHLLLIEDQQQKKREIEAAIAQLVATRDDFLRAGLPCPIVSAGGTGSYAITAACPGVTELQAGGLIFMDMFYRTRCQISEFDYAIKLLTTVVSRPAPERAIIDAGRKTHIVDVAPPMVIGREDIRCTRLSAEHGWLELAPSASDLRIGDRLELIPGYTDFTNVLHDEFYVFRGGKLVAIWPLAGRGKIR
jgi:D-serine deaminase-like pyridoxal phosphate-dependent protein